MTEDPTGSAGPWPRRSRVLLLVLGFLLAAIVGGVAGGLIVKAIWTSSASGVTATSGASCQAAKVAGEALPSVVTVQASNRGLSSGGSGVVVRSGGYILTNNHVINVAADGGRLSITRSDGEASDATLVGRDPLTDLAVVQAEPATGLPVIALGDSGSLEVGQPVIALGSPLGLASSVTAGIVSALNRYVRVPTETAQPAHLVGAIQTDASINPGNSGGALVDCDARLVGINTAAASVSNTGGSIGLGFAIPIDLAKRLADQLIANGKVSRASFGMQVQEIPEQLARASGGTAGLFVESVTAGGPADRAGLRPGDVIVEVGGAPAESVDALILKSIELKAGDTVRLTYKRQGATHTTVLTLAG